MSRSLKGIKNSTQEEAERMADEFRKIANGINPVKSKPMESSRGEATTFYFDFEAGAGVEIEHRVSPFVGGKSGFEIESRVWVWTLDAQGERHQMAYSSFEIRHGREDYAEAVAALAELQIRLDKRVQKSRDNLKTMNQRRQLARMIFGD